MATWSCEDLWKTTNVGTSMGKKESMDETCKLVVWTKESLVVNVRLMELLLLVRTRRKDPFAARII
jgi:hypothetical protein